MTPLLRTGLTVLVAGVLLLAACDDDDDAADGSPTPTTSPTATATPTETSEPDSAPTGVAEIDQIIDLVLAGDADGLANAVVLTNVECAGPDQQGLGGPPTCEDGESPGDIVSAFPAAACEGYWVRDPSPVLSSFVSDVVALYAVVEAPASPPEDTLFPFGTHTVIFRAATPVGTEGFTLTLDEGAIVSLQTGCRPPQDFLTFRGEALPVLFGPVEDGDSDGQTSDDPPDRNATLAPTFDAVRDDAAGRAGVTAAEVTLQRGEPVIWSNACLGIESDGACAEVLVSGWVLWVQAGDELHRYHADRELDVRWAEGPVDLGTTPIPELPLPEGATLDIA